MAVPFDNSPEKSLTSLSNHTGEGIVIDIGTGDGRFVSAAARANPCKFFIGIDANVKPLEKPSMKATRKLAKGGLPNVLFVQAAVEDLPAELDGTADEVHIHFPWGSLLKAVACGDQSVLVAIRRLCSAECLVEIVIGIDPVRDRAEIERLEISDFTAVYLGEVLVPSYEVAGFKVLEFGTLTYQEWSRLETSWARKLGGNSGRMVTYLVAQN